jgi:hypothetical protein
MKSLLPTCFLPLAVTFTLHSGAPVIFEKPDTVIIHSTGRYNRVVIDSIQLNDSLTEYIMSPVKGEIIQTGENNRVEIKTGGEKPKNNTQKTNNHQITISKKPATSNQLEQSVYPDGRNPDISSDKPATSNQQPGTSNQQHVTIKQTGKNNSVKINSR